MTNKSSLSPSVLKAILTLTGLVLMVLGGGLALRATGWRTDGRRALQRQEETLEPTCKSRGTRRGIQEKSTGLKTCHYIEHS